MTAPVKNPQPPLFRGQIRAQVRRDLEQRDEIDLSYYVAQLARIALERKQKK